MGNQHNKALEERTKEYVKQNLTKDEIQHYKRIWMGLFPTGVATKQTFPRFIEQMGLRKDATFVDMMFRSMDQNRDNKMEYLWYEALVLTKATAPIEYLIEHTFSVYDENGDGFIQKEELFDTMKNIYAFNGQDVNDPAIRKDIQEKVRKVMSAVDENKDGKISKREIAVAYRRDPSVFDLF